MRADQRESLLPTATLAFQRHKRLRPFGREQAHRQADTVLAGKPATLASREDDSCTPTGLDCMRGSHPVHKPGIRMQSRTSDKAERGKPTRAQAEQKQGRRGHGIRSTQDCRDAAGRHEKQAVKSQRLLT
tara:strand:- start:1600 stop:1989 length:390 start_codon:yes stop_codon:yes gene_type:complete